MMTWLRHLLSKERELRMIWQVEREGTRSYLVGALDPATIRRINQELERSSKGLSSHRMFRSLMGSDPDALDWDRTRGMRPWMAFFQIWSHYLRQNGWTYTMELDALRIAGVLGKSVHCLETMEEQLEALDDVPFERFVHFLTMEKGPTIAFVGASHCRGIGGMLLEAGYRVGPPSFP